MSRLIIDELLAQPQAITWLPWAVQYFFFIGLAACATLFACVAHWWRKGSRNVERICLFIALTCAITAPLALTADLHQTARFWHFYAWPTPWSWMPWGALFLPLFMLLLGLWFCAFHLKELTGRTFSFTRWLAIGAALTAIGLLLYTGREVSIVRARPLWFSYWFPVAMLVSAMQMLLALLILVMRKHSRPFRFLTYGHVCTLLLLGVVMQAWYFGDTLSGQAMRQWWEISGEARLYTALFIGMWTLSLAGALYTSRYPVPFVGTVLLTLCAMGSCWVLRWAILIGGQTIPKYNALTNPYHLPYGTDGLLAIIGTFGLWFALIITLRESLNWLTRRSQNG